jgi:GAF domain-containing protein
MAQWRVRSRVCERRTRGRPETRLSGAGAAVPRCCVSTQGSDAPNQRGRPSTQDTGTTVALDELARRLAEAARGLQQQTDPQQVLDRVVSLAVAMVPGADEATITMVRARRDVYSAAATGELARWFDALQNETGQGPCLDAMWQEQTTRVDDLATDPRWPVLGPRAGARGVGSMLCLQLFVHEDTLGALDLLAHQKSAFTDESEHIGLLLASHSAIAVADAQKLGHAAIALVNRDVIGQAKGILMERFKITADQAFDVLAKVSQDTNRKVYAVAEDLTRTGTLAR